MNAPDLTSLLLPALVAWPFLAALLVRPLGRRSEGARNAFVLASVAATFVGTVILVWRVGRDVRLEAGVPALVGRLELMADPFGAFFALFATFVWLAVALFSLDYLKHEEHRDRFHGTSLVVLGSTLGVVLAGNLVTLFLFFEALGLMAWLLVVHRGTQEARRASFKYFWMTVGGGFLLLAGILLTFALGGEGALAPLPVDTGGAWLRGTAAGLLVLGFGVKAGMLPVHVWLPDAHSVAPTPASALLSGVMIKIGAYGIFRTLTALFPPTGEGGPGVAGWTISGGLGLSVLWIGIATMAVGVVLALGQHNAKRLLAYHSVSQMGFILAGLGAGAYLAGGGAMGTGGGLLHAANHALFKATLFLGVGAVAFRTGELDLHRLGGLWRRMPLTFAFMTVAAAGITGMPLFNGFVSKSLIHHALVEASEAGGLRSLAVAEKVFMITAAGTVASFVKLLGLLFLKKPLQDPAPRVGEAPWGMLTAMGMLSAAILVLGVRPDLLLNGLLAPGLEAWALSSEGIERYLDLYFLGTADLLSSASVFLLGSLVFAVGMRWKLFDLRAPDWIGVDFWYRRGVHAALALARRAGDGYERARTAPGRRVRSWFQADPSPGDRTWASPVERRGAWALPGVARAVDRAAALRDRLRVPEDFDAEAGVARTRHGIRRYVRDMSVNIALIFVLMLVFILALLLDLGR